MPSLKNALAGIGEADHRPIAMRATFGGRTPPSLRDAMAGMTNPHVRQWAKVGVALYSENTSLSEEAQGAATDGHRWYVCSNNLKGVVAFDDEGDRVDTFGPSLGILHTMWLDAGSPMPPEWLMHSFDPYLVALGWTWSPHFGAPDFFEGWIHVPVQGPHGVWRFRVDGTEQAWRKADELPDGNLFPWCGIHPVTGVLYTINYGAPKTLFAYDRQSLDRRPADDVALEPAPIHLDRVQGGVFTKRGRLILVRSDYNAVFCYSSLNGHCFGAKRLGDFGI